MQRYILSNEEENRVCVWLSVLQKTCDYLVVCEKAYDRLICLKGTECEYYYVGSSRVTYFEPWVVEKGLSEAALIGLISVLYGSGEEGVGISGDKNAVLIDLSKEVVSLASSKLGYNDIREFEEYLSNLKKMRNRTIAHYNGKYADYKEHFIENNTGNGGSIRENPSMVSMKMASAHFTYNEIKQLKKTAICLLESLREVLLEYT